MTDESQALLAGAAAFVVLTLVALLIFGGQDIPLAGRLSVATVGALGGAVVGAATFAFSAFRARQVHPDAALFRAGRVRSLIDLFSLALAHGIVALLLWLGLFTLLQESFLGAVLYPIAAAVMVGAVGSATAYVSYLSATRMDAYRLATLLAVFLVGGMLASMLTASDPNWWQRNLSALGASADASGKAFNITLLVAGALVTALASFATRPSATPPVHAPTAEGSAPAAGSFSLLQGGLTLLGVLLACVGLFPVDELFVVHTIAASGMVVTYAVLVIRVRRFVQGATVEFISLGYAFLAVIIIAALLYFPFGYYNLTAVELIAGLLIFTWLIVLVRTLAAHETDDASDGVVERREAADGRPVPPSSPADQKGSR
ncbi:hypothetical protein [Mycetocola zhadangensis]|uniref:hypothetical protein n=1 Tax=Mycetocola zhadangensis TaxID=1164595 RepID=UPI0011C3516C|nr:hypothetical protein [Mycetocola zhadangensis]